MASLLVVSTIVNVFFSVVLTYYVGLPGPLLGTLIALASVNMLGFSILLRRSFGVSLRQLSAAVFVPVGYGIPYAILVWWGSHHYKPSGWLELGTQMFVAMCLFLVFWWLVGFSAVERKTYPQRFRAILGWN
jgi:peptidoglycan biosynthesis protein MviN/MurJ (putative lipid II flippase)